MTSAGAESHAPETTELADVVKDPMEETAGARELPVMCSELWGLDS